MIGSMFRCFIVGIIVASNCVHSQTSTGSDSTKTIQTTSVVNSDSILRTGLDTLRRMPNVSFAGGEYLKFDVNYGFITAGEAVMKIEDTVYEGSRKCFKINFIVDSKPFFDIVYKVRDRYRTYVDADGVFPWRFEQHIREGGYSRDFIADFDQIHHTAITSEGKYNIPSYVQDIMSAFYFARTVDYSNFKPGDKVHLQNFYKDSTYQLDVRYKGKQEIEVAAGKFRCIVIEPLAKEGGLFKSEGKVYVWLTDDERKMPVKVSSKVAIGSIDSELIEYHGINGALNGKINDN